MEKNYDPHQIEDKWYKNSLDKGYFKAEADSKKKPYTIVIPPPNVTGILHMGHALNNTIQDVQVRFKRMQGYSACWMAGTDHAGIATQNVVERKLAADGLKKEDLGREKFQDELWAWKKERGSTIINQLKKLGASCDWDRTRFTMDSQYSEAVREVFVHLFEKDLIYKGNRIVNWCPRCLTALSDEEAEHNTSEGHLWHLRYPVVEKGTPDAPDYVVVATTRPETMLGDTGLAINPADTRYEWLKTSKVILPFMNRELKIIEDEHIDIEFGTGVVKVTPAHDPNDFDMGKRHDLEFINVMNDDGSMNQLAGEFAGMDRYECRETLVELMKEKKLIEKIEPYELNAGYCYRCHTVVEPRLSPQWFVKMQPLAEPALNVVKDGSVKFTPQRWEKVYLNWMENIHDWCISRQIWWGHRIPIWYCDKCQNTKSELENRESKIENGKTKSGRGIYASRTDLTQCPDCGSTDIYQDPDVLDTWFSSWLWPFATFGWPFRKGQGSSSKGQGTHEGPNTEDFEQQKRDLAYFYPTNMLTTASEILFFWVARMIMAGIEFQGKVPFEDVYIHGTVRDDKGIKMSKSLGNTIDPLDIIEKYGADALRFSLMLLCASGSDVYLSEDKFLVGRNFANKMWNATRFVLSKIDVKDAKESLDGFELTFADKWILAQTDKLIVDVTYSLNKYRNNDAVREVYEFFRTKYCDWYIEISKIETNPAKASILIYVLKTVMKLLHPFMPFITEEIYMMLNPSDESIVTAQWPEQLNIASADVIEDFVKLQNLVVGIRGFKKSLVINAKNDVAVIGDKAATIAVEASKDWIKFLARLNDIQTTEFSEDTVANATLDYEIFFKKEGIEGLDEHKARIEKRLAELLGFTKSNQKKLENKNFVERAPADVINGVKEMIENNRIEIEHLQKIKF